MSLSRNQSRPILLSIIFMVATVIFWGYSFISTKIVLTEEPPVSIAFFRQIIAALILIPWVMATKSHIRVSLKDMGLILASALFGIVLYFICENNGLRYTTAANASMIVAAVPIFTLFSESLFFKMKITPRMVICILLSILGVYLIISSNGRLDFSSAAFRGNLLVIGAMVCWVIYTIINKGLSSRYSSLQLIMDQSIGSIFLFIPFILPEAHYWQRLTWVPFFNLLYLGVFCSAISYFFFIYAVKRLGATVSSAFLNLIPVVTVISGFFVLGEKLIWLQILGMLVTLVSLFYLNYQKTPTEIKVEASPIQTGSEP